MALDTSSLQSALQDVLDALPASPDLAADGFAKAYADYAADGTFGANVPAVTDEMRAALKATLTGGISNPLVGLPATFAGAWASGVGTFWTGTVVAGPTQSGTTASCPGASGLTGSLSTVFANLTNTTSTCAAGMANALDTATKTVHAIVSPPAATDIPIA